MTSLPHAIDERRSIAEASTMLRSLGIAHLPVVRSVDWFGLLCARDVALLERIPSFDAHTVPVAELMLERSYTVSPDTSIEEVIAQMAHVQCSAVLVVHDAKPVGIFTELDALALAWGFLEDS